MTKHYKLNQAAFEEKKKAMLKRVIILFIIAVSAGFLMATINAGFDWSVLLIMIPIAGLAGYFGIRRALKNQQEAWESYEIRWYENTLEKHQVRTKPVSFQRSDITEIIEHKEGLTIKTNKKSAMIFIPKELDDFDELISALKA